jgi:hypothetical protein
MTEWKLAEADFNTFREYHTLTLLIEAAYN